MTSTDHGITGTRVHILGSGTPTPTPQRFGSSFAVQVADQTLMVDCGPAATAKLVQAGLWPTRVSELFITHHHFDHSVDLPCFLLTRWDQSIGAEAPLRIRGPQPTEWVVDRLIGPDGAFHHDWQARINWVSSQRVFVNRGGTLPRPAPAFDVKDIVVGDVEAGPGWTMRTGLARHAQPWLDSIAYRLETEQGSVVFTGDTEPCDEIVELSAGADLMFCMCWDNQSDMDECGESAGQCGTDGAAGMAEKAGVKRLVLVHTGPAVSRPGAREAAVRHVSEIFHGEIVFADELMAIDL
jgi:ribonuclease BN (tRNA processing enzyme)